MALARLERIDADRNMARFYRVDVVPTLFGEACLLKTWGRIGTRGRTMFETCASADEAIMGGEQIIRAKTRRGYLPAGSGT